MVIGHMPASLVQGRRYDAGLAFPDCGRLYYTAAVGGDCSTGFWLVLRHLDGRVTHTGPCLWHQGLRRRPWCREETIMVIGVVSFRRHRKACGNAESDRMGTWTGPYGVWTGKLRQYENWRLPLS
ncbi:MAG TPA: hypothetical protein DD856_00230 [Sulfobacillus sp.]|nr:hypothetical protein [Sulfobacillus sp.]